MDISSITLDAIRSMTATELDAAQAALDEELRTLHLTDAGELRDLSDDEQTRFDKLMQLRNRVEAHGKIRKQFDRGNYSVALQGSQDGESHHLSGVYGEARRVIDSAVRSHLLPDHAAEKATALVEQGAARDRSVAANWVRTTGDQAYLRAFGKLMGDPERGHLLWTPEEQAAYRAVQEFRAMSEGTTTAGGYMVPLSLDPSIMLTSAGSNNPLRQISRVVQTVTNSWTGVTSAGATAEWKTEASEAADGSPTLANPVIPVYFGDSFVPYSFELGQDAVNFVQELQAVLVDAADQLMATGYTTGTGTNQPTGIVTALVASSPTVLVTSATTDTFAKADVFALQNALPARFSANASWVANISVINLMAQMELSTGGSRAFPEVENGRLLGKPINELSNMDGVINASQENYILAYGDFKAGFVIADRIGTTLELIPNLVGANRRPTGQRGALLWFRTGSDSVVDNAFRMLNVT